MHLPAFSTLAIVIFAVAVLLGLPTLVGLVIPPKWRVAKWLCYLVWPTSTLTAIFCAAAFVGMLCAVAGILLRVPWLSTLGIWLGVPLVAGGVAIMILIIPMLIYWNIKGGRKP